MKYKVLRKQNNSAKCIVCGPKNGLSLNARFFEVENEQGEVLLLAVFKPRPEHQSYPGRTHGGITAAILDEAVGRAMQIQNPNVWGVTIELSIKYRKVVPYDEELYCETKITKTASRSFEGEGKLLSKDGTVLATSYGKYLVLPVDKIAEEGLDEENWYYIDEEVPEYIEIG